MAGTDIVPFEGYAIAKVEINDLLETISENIGDGQLNEGSLDRVKMPSGGSVTWEVPTLDGDVSEKALTGVVIYTKLVRAYWIKSFEEGGGNDLPDCSSRDSKVAFPAGEFTPPAQPHENGGFACATCALAQFGSAEKGDGQACQQKRLVFMLTQGDVLPIVVALAPTSLKPAGDYLARLTRAGVPYWKVGTQITLNKFSDPQPHARAVFTKAFDLTDDDVARIADYRRGLIPAFENVGIEIA